MTSEEPDTSDKGNSAPVKETTMPATGEDAPEPCKASRLRLAIGPLSPEVLAACSRVLARFAVEQAQIELGLLDLDKGSDHCSSESDEPSHQQINGPVSVRSTDGAKEQVL